jgi:hypothetical protein
MNSRDLLPDNDFIERQPEPAKLVYLAASSTTPCLGGSQEGATPASPDSALLVVSPPDDLEIPPFLRRGNPECVVSGGAGHD